MTRAQARVRRIAAERRTKGMAIADAVKAQRADHQVEVDRMDVAAEQSRRDAAREQIFDRMNDGDVAAFEGLHLLDILRAVNILNRDEADEVALAVVIVECKLDQRAHALD